MSILTDFEAIQNALSPAKRQALSAEIDSLSTFVKAHYRQLVAISVGKARCFYGRAEGGNTQKYETLDDAALAVGISPTSLYQCLGKGKGLWSRTRGGLVAIATSRERLDEFFARFTNP